MLQRMTLYTLHLFKYICRVNSSKRDWGVRGSVHLEILMQEKPSSSFLPFTPPA